MRYLTILLCTRFVILSCSGVQDVCKDENIQELYAALSLFCEDKQLQSLVFDSPLLLPEEMGSVKSNENNQLLSENFSETLMSHTNKKTPLSSPVSFNPQSSLLLSTCLLTGIAIGSLIFSSKPVRLSLIKKDKKKKPRRKLVKIEHSSKKAQGLLVPLYPLP